MILSFSKTWPWNGEPTNFIDKIKRGEKIHTIREDKHERWREGMDIHFATGVRTPNYNQFYSDICTGVQEIKIKIKNATHKETGTDISYPEKVTIDGREIPVGGKIFPTLDDNMKTILKLTKNDGFYPQYEPDIWSKNAESLKLFFTWFDEDFEGRLIHWTDFRY